MLMKTKSGRLVEVPSDEEDAAITAAALDDPDAPPLTEEDVVQLKPILRRGRPRLESPKKQVTIRFSEDVLAHFQKDGKGWQTRMDAALREYIAEHS